LKLARRAVEFFFRRGFFSAALFSPGRRFISGYSGPQDPRAQKSHARGFQATGDINFSKLRLQAAATNLLTGFNRDD